MVREPVDLRIGGRNYRLVADTDADTLKRLAVQLNDRLKQVGSHPEALMLVALGLARDVEELTKKNQRLTTRASTALRSVLTRLDEALDHVDEQGNPLPPVPSSPR